MSLVARLMGVCVMLLYVFVVNICHSTRVGVLMPNPFLLPCQHVTSPMCQHQVIRYYELQWN